MKANIRLKLSLILALVATPVCGQSPAGEIKTFAKDGLSFSYPAGWTLTDKSNTQAQHLVLSQEKSSVVIMVVAYRELLASKEQFFVGVNNITAPYIESIAKNFKNSGQRAERDYPCIEIEGQKISGTRIRGSYQKEPSTGEVYTLTRGHRFINLIYIRADKDAPGGNSVWENIYRTVKVDDPIPTVASDLPTNGVIVGGLLNAKAVRLPMPRYPGIAQGARAIGTVVVEITVDESGNVTSATAVTGHPMLRKVSEMAALEAKFPPFVICSQPVKMTGTLAYNFMG